MEDGRVGISTESFLVDPALQPGAGLNEANSRGNSGATRKGVLSLLGIAGLVVLLLHLQGSLAGGKVAPGIIQSARRETVPAGRAVPVLHREIDDVLEWPGTVRSRVVTQVAPKILARIARIEVEVGSVVQSGEVVAVLDDRDLTSRLDQAKAALASAEAQAVQSDAEHRRVQGLFEKEAATRRDLESALARSQSARAQVDQARHAVAESGVLLSESILRAPFEGVITEKWAQAGDTAVPGKPIVTIQDPRRLRLEAHIPEACARKATLGMEVRVRVDSLDRETTARIEEIAPVAEPESRTFLLKAGLSPVEGIRPGMFGRFIQSCGRKTAFLVPAPAILRSGQLELVQVLEDGKLQIRHIRTGKSYGNLVEVLSGLREGENVLEEGN